MMLIVNKFLRSRSNWHAFHPPLPPPLCFCSYILFFFSIHVLSSYCKLPHCGRLGWMATGFLWSHFINLWKHCRAQTGLKFALMGTCTQPIKYEHTCKYIPSSYLEELGSCLRDLITSSSGLLGRGIIALSLAYCVGFIFPRLAIFFCSLSTYSLEENTWNYLIFFRFRPFMHGSFRASSPITIPHGFHGENAPSIIRPAAGDGPPVAISAWPWQCVLGWNVLGDCCYL